MQRGRGECRGLVVPVRLGEQDVIDPVSGQPIGSLKEFLLVWDGADDDGRGVSVVWIGKILAGVKRSVDGLNRLLLGREILSDQDVKMLVYLRF